MALRRYVGIGASAEPVPRLKRNYPAGDVIKHEGIYHFWHEGFDGLEGKELVRAAQQLFNAVVWANLVDEGFLLAHFGQAQNLVVHENGHREIEGWPDVIASADIKLEPTTIIASIVTDDVAASVAQARPHVPRPQPKTTVHRIAKMRLKHPNFAKALDTLGEAGRSDLRHVKEHIIQGVKKSGWPWKGVDLTKRLARYAETDEATISALKDTLHHWMHVERDPPHRELTEKEVRDLLSRMLRGWLNSEVPT